MKALNRFLKYAKVFTASDDDSDASPSTERQLALIHILESEMKELGLTDVHLDGNGNVYGTLPASDGVSAPSVALIAHVDTSPDAPGENVTPVIKTFVPGICLDSGEAVDEVLFPGISAYEGEDIVFTDGTTLLGSDDKAGVAEIMSAIERIISDGIPHGRICVIFTTDEEVGRGAEGIAVDELRCDFGYTVDGGAIDELEYENFNAASGVLRVKGVGVHPGSGKGIMINASGVAFEFHSMLPSDQIPEKTEGYEGFFHLTDMSGSVTSAELHYIIRDHDMDKFNDKKALFIKNAALINEKYGAGTVEAEVSDSYYNMKEKILPHMELIEHAKSAFAAHGVEVRAVPIRGGTDGAVLSWLGLPCPNLPAGGYNFHSVREWIPVSSIEKMVQILVTLVSGFVK